MTREKHFHPIAALHFLRKTLAVYLIPLVNVLFERNWEAFWLALRQDAVLFALLCGVSWVILERSSWQLDEAGVLHLRWRLLVQMDTRVRACSFAAVLGSRTLTAYAGIALPTRQVVPRRAITSVRQLRTPLLRLAGASVLIVTAPGARLILPAVPAEQAAALARALTEGIR